MKVLKFGGSSLADATRYLRVFEISVNTHQNSADNGAAVVLSAPKGVTNALSLLCEQARTGKDFGELLAKLDMTLNGIATELNETLNGFDYNKVKSFIDERLSLLADQLQGISLLKTCPDHEAPY